MRLHFARAAADRDRYDAASWLQREVAKRMAERLDYIKLTPDLVVDAGAGSGHALAALAARFPDATLVAVDIVSEQLRRLVPRSLPVEWLQRFFRTSRTHAVAADFARLPLRDRSAGCVWSNLALHWAPDPAAVFVEWHRVIDTGGLVLFSSLGPDTLRELRHAWGAAGTAGAANRVHPFIDMHDIGDMLVHAGFADPVMDMETITLTYRDVDALVADLRGAGAAGSHVARPRGLTGRRLWRAMRDAYESLRHQGTLPATFEIVYGHAWKPAPRVRAGDDGIARVRIEDVGGRSRNRQR